MAMDKFQQTFRHSHGNVIGMIHTGALPGTPKHNQSIQQIIDAAVREAHIYTKLGAVRLTKLYFLPKKTENNKIASRRTPC